MVENPDDPAVQKNSQDALDALFTQVLDWQGAITGEHGIGLAKQPWWTQALTEETRALHQTLKKALDPAGLLNPGKFV
jgi:glycolate oxidase